MKLQRTTEYALQTMAALSLAGTQPLSSGDLHRQLGIPRKYLQRLLTRLTKHGLVRSSRGRTGGYVLRRPPGKVSLLEVVESVEDLSRSPQCFFGFGACPLDDRCAIHDRWSAHQRFLLRVLTSTHLSDLTPRRRR